ncbi:RNA polymerase sigma factor [Streptomyces apocyni]|uniref:RNA polymerase sigma factor n=1 Tax=Streptomyces apocyni TaxID=2654677 RepID=UPI0012E9AE57|nr:sigma-70 family RNA polymerase sigma factor [Streptomyces apocyni]
MSEAMRQQPDRDPIDDALLDELEAEPRPDAQARGRVYEEIARRHQDPIVRRVAPAMGYDLTATEDVVQETFYDAFRYLEQHVTIPAPRLLGPWLHGVARNRRYANWRKHRELLAADESAVAELSDGALARQREVRDDPAATDEAARLIEEVRTALSEEERRLFQLRFTKGIRPGRIAVKLGRNPSTVSDHCTHLTKKVGRYVGLLLLVRGDRTKCPELRTLLEEYEDRNGARFTAELAKLVQRHLDTCPTCGDCEVWRVEQREQLRMHAPVVFPLLLGLGLRRAIEHRIQEVCHSGSRVRRSPVAAVPTACPRSDALRQANPSTLAEAPLGDLHARGRCSGHRRRRRTRSVARRTGDHKPGEHPWSRGHPQRDDRPRAGRGRPETRRACRPRA